MCDTRRRRAYLLAISFAVASVIAGAIDMPVARFVSDSGMPGDLRKLFSVSEVFAHGMGVALILLAVVVLDPTSRRRVPRVACSAYGAGLIAQVAKLLLPRLRPHVCDLSVPVWRTFFLGGADRYVQLESLSGRDVHSFPSGHSATAVGLAFGLAWLYPRGRWLFAFYALLAMMQRVESGAHFVSDTLAGAAIACLVAALCYGDGKLDRIFKKL
ncbi:MAG: phosphatase PAP2 family protein [Planctomycetota bacterium]